MSRGRSWFAAVRVLELCVCQSKSIILYNLGCMTLVLASEEKAVGKTKTTFSFILLSFPLTAKLALSLLSSPPPPPPPGYAARLRDAAQPPPHPRIRRHCSLRCRQRVTKAKGLEEKGKKKKIFRMQYQYYMQQVCIYIRSNSRNTNIQFCWLKMIFSWL